jgi:RHS repeat-associated protein
MNRDKIRDHLLAHQHQWNAPQRPAALSSLVPARLTPLSASGLTIGYTYNGLGDRLSQFKDGVTTHYTLDLNAGLTQVLQDGTNTYLYGVNRIAQVAETQTGYFLPDALGSVRQMTDAYGDVTLTQDYTPRLRPRRGYGEILTSEGTTTTDYAFTGESYDSYIKLQYLRSRWYSPQSGRFTTKDIWQGNYTRPHSLNGWNYVEGNPTNRTDPSGHSPLLCEVPFIGCVDTAKNAILAAKAAYSQVGPTLLALSQREPWNNRFNCLDPRWSKPERAIDLLADYFCERGPDRVVFNGNDALSKEMARSVLLDEVRKEFYSNGDISVPKERKFNEEFALAFLDAIDPVSGNFHYPLTHFLGSFDYKVVKVASGRVEFQIDNRTDLASGTHIPFRFPPDNERTNPYSLEQFIQEHPEMGNEGVLDVLMGYPEIVSILEPRTRQETGLLMGGGNMYQTFKWSEQHLDCGLQNLPWPVYLPLLDIR